MADKPDNFQELSAIESSRLAFTRRALHGHFGADRAEQILERMNSAVPHRRPELDDTLKPDTKEEK